MKFGFSTGVFDTLSPLSLLDRLEILSKTRTPNIEIGFARLERFENFDLDESPQELKQYLDTYERVSLHAPKFFYQSDVATDKVFEKISKVHKLHPLDLVVFHPDMIKDFSVFTDLEFPVAFENMDEEKKSYRTVMDMESILSKNSKFKMVLDVNHVFRNDPTMKSAKEFFDALGSAIDEIHLSGSIKKHDPLFLTKQNFIAEAIVDLEIPIIIESTLTAEQINMEKEYVSNLLQSIEKERPNV